MHPVKQRALASQEKKEPPLSVNEKARLSFIQNYLGQDKALFPDTSILHEGSSKAYRQLLSLFGKNAYFHLTTAVRPNLVFSFEGVLLESLIQLQKNQTAASVQIYLIEVGVVSGLAWEASIGARYGEDRQYTMLKNYPLASFMQPALFTDDVVRKYSPSLATALTQYMGSSLERGLQFSLLQKWMKKHPTTVSVNVTNQAAATIKPELPKQGALF